MNELIIARANQADDLHLYPVERVMPLIKRYTGQSPDLREVVQSIGECQEEIGHKYGSQYLALLRVEPTGDVMLPLHARKVVAVHPGPWHVSQDSAAYCAGWEPGLGLGYPQGGPWPGRQWVADQIGLFTCWREATLENIARSPYTEQVPYSRTAHGIRVKDYRQQYQREGLVRHVLVVYDAELTDSRGFPLVNDRDARACAHYWNWQRLQTILFSGGKVDPTVLQLAMQNMETYIGQARVGDGPTDEDWEMIMRTATSWDRASFAAGTMSPEKYPVARYEGGYGWAADGYNY